MRILNLIIRTVEQDEAILASHYFNGRVAGGKSANDSSNAYPPLTAVPDKPNPYYVMQMIQGDFTTNETSLLLTKNLYAIPKNCASEELLSWANGFPVQPAHPFFTSGAYDWLTAKVQAIGQKKISDQIESYGFKEILD